MTRKLATRTPWLAPTGPPRAQLRLKETDYRPVPGLRAWLRRQRKRWWWCGQCLVVMPLAVSLEHRATVHPRHRH